MLWSILRAVVWILVVSVSLLGIVTLLDSTWPISVDHDGLYKNIELKNQVCIEDKPICYNTWKVGDYDTGIPLQILHYGMFIEESDSTIDLYRYSINHSYSS